MKGNKGITLVALIITIIVMMILVAVSVAVIINSDLLGTAKNAGESYKAKAGEEGNLSGDDVQITVGDKTYNSIEEYKNSLTSDTFKFYIDDVEYEFDDENKIWGYWATTEYNKNNYIMIEDVWDLGYHEAAMVFGPDACQIYYLKDGVKVYQYGLDEIIAGEHYIVPTL